MRKINRTRFKVTTFSLAALFICLFWSIHKELNDVASALSLIIGTVISMYGWSETKRKSE